MDNPLIVLPNSALTCKGSLNLFLPVYSFCMFEKIQEAGPKGEFVDSVDPSFSYCSLLPVVSFMTKRDFWNVLCFGKFLFILLKILCLDNILFSLFVPLFISLAFCNIVVIRYLSSSLSPCFMWKIERHKKNSKAFIFS